MLEVVTLSIALAMDATAVAAARGLAGHVPAREAVIMPSLFGGFQAGMAAAGWLAGKWIGPTVDRWNGWIAFGVLLVLGIKMIVESLRGGDDDSRATGELVTMLGLALATSIDAAAAGVTLPLVDAPMAVSLAMIGGVTLVLSALGLAVGKWAGARFGSRLEIVGGLALIGIGTKILVDHL